MSDEPANMPKGILADRLARMIALNGPLSLADYCHICLNDPDEGYYRKRLAFGAEGDFITAPDVSQMFGELIGIWCLSTWHKLGRPNPFSLAELGPGRGTMMADILRAAAIDPGFIAAMQLYLVEASERLINIQRQAIGRQPANWIADVSGLPEMPTIIIANEFLDALPFRQYVKRGKAFHEVAVTLDENKQLCFTTTASVMPDDLLPENHGAEPDGSVFEYAPAREAVADALASHLAHFGGAALLIDYGHLKSGFGDTFQAVLNHQKTDPLVRPGFADLTSHVDFARLVPSLAAHGIKPAFTRQSDFLLELGLLERAGKLGAGKPPDKQSEISQSVERLAGPEQMGNLFKVMGFSNPPLVLDGFGKHAGNSN